MHIYLRGTFWSTLPIHLRVGCPKPTSEQENNSHKLPRAHGAPNLTRAYILASLTKSYLWCCDAVRTEREETSASHFQLRKIYLKHLSSWKSDGRQSCSKTEIRWKVGKNFFLSWIQLFWSSQNHNIFKLYDTKCSFSWEIRIIQQPLSYYEHWMQLYC